MSLRLGFPQDRVIATCLAPINFAAGVNEHVRYWHLADTTTVLGDVCFRWNSGHCLGVMAGPLLTQSGSGTPYFAVTHNTSFL